MLYLLIMTVAQTTSPLLAFNTQQWKATLVKNMVGKKLNQLRTPSLVIDRKIVEKNCKKLSSITAEFSTKVRVHVKTHKVKKKIELLEKKIIAD